MRYCGFIGWHKHLIAEKHVCRDVYFCQSSQNSSDMIGVARLEDPNIRFRSC